MMAEAPNIDQYKYHQNREITIAQDRGTSCLGRLLCCRVHGGAKAGAGT